MIRAWVGAGGKKKARGMEEAKCGRKELRRKRRQ